MSKLEPRGEHIHVIKNAMLDGVYKDTLPVWKRKLRLVPSVDQHIDGHNS